MDSTTAHLLVVDDEIQMRRLLRLTLEHAGYHVTLAENGAEALRLGSEHPFDLIVLDLGLPDIDGLEILKKIRSWAEHPIVILSARTAEDDIVAALDAGANDYLTKPFRSKELLARIRTALRIHARADASSTVITVKGIEIDIDKRVVRKNGVVVKLTPTEFSLLALFVRNAGKVLTHSYILQQVWGPQHQEDSQYTRVYVGQLRKKLEDDPNNPGIFLTESGIGYRFIDQDDE